MGNYIRELTRTILPPRLAGMPAGLQLVDKMEGIYRTPGSAEAGRFLPSNLLRRSYAVYTGWKDSSLV